MACTSSSNHTVFERFWALRAPKYHRSSSRGQYVAPAFRDPGSGVCLEAQRHQSTARNRLGVAETAENPRVCADPTTRGRNRLEPAALQRPISRRDRRDAQIRCPRVPVRARMQVDQGRAAKFGACGSLVRLLRPSAHDARVECARGLLTKGMDCQRASIFTRLRNRGCDDKRDEFESAYRAFV